MLIPYENIVYRNLKSSFTNFNELLVNLNSISLTGFVHLEFQGFQSIVFLQNGRVCNAFAEFNSVKKLGQEAFNYINAKVREAGGQINVYSLSSELIMLFSNSVKNEIVYKDLSSEFTSLDKLIAKLQEEQHTGHIEAISKSGNKKAFIFFQTGEILKMLLSVIEKPLFEVDEFQEIKDTFSNAAVVFNVYKSNLSLVNSNSWLTTTYEISEMLELWGAIIQVVEKQVGSETFASIFKQVLFEHADKYLFLDPFLGEFKYADGKIILKSKSVQNFDQALKEVLRTTIAKLNIQKPSKVDLDQVREKFAEVIDKYSLTNLIYDLTA